MDTPAASCSEHLSKFKEAHMNDQRQSDEYRIQRIEGKIDKLTEAVAMLVGHGEKFIAMEHRMDAIENFMARAYVDRNEEMKEKIREEKRITDIESRLEGLKNNPTTRAIVFLVQVAATVIVTISVTKIMQGGA